MDIEKIQKINDMTKGYKKHNLDFNASDSVKKQEEQEMSESEKLLRKLHFGIKYNKDEIESLKDTINSLREEIKDLKQKHKEQVQKEYNEKKQRIEEPQKKLSQNTNSSKKMTEPIDRNNIAPSDVSIESIFYCGER